MKSAATLLLFALAVPLFPLRVAFLPFINSTDYHGHWMLSKDIPRYLMKTLRPGYTSSGADTALNAGRLSPEEKQALAKQLGADLLVTGEVTEFTVRKLIMGEGKYGGMKNYLGKIAVKLSIFSVAEGKTLYKDEISVEKKETLTAVNLGKLSEDETRFDQLNEEKFGSPAFEKTVAGEMMRGLAEKMNNALVSVQAAGGVAAPEKKLIKTAKIVDLTGGDVYLNAGTEDGVTRGDIFSVFTPGDSLRDPDTGEFLGMAERYVGKIRIATVTASHFSRAEKVEEKEPFKQFDLVRVEK